MVTFMIILKIFCILMGLLLIIWGIVETVENIKRGWADCTLLASMVIVGGLFLASIGVFAIA